MGDSSEQRQPEGWLPAILDRWAEKQGDEVAFAFLGDGEGESERLTYGGLRERSLGVAHALRTRGLAGTGSPFSFRSAIESLCVG